MKNHHIILILLFTGVFLMAANLSTERSLKIGHLNSMELLEQLPEVIKANERLTMIERENMAHLEEMAKEYEQKREQLQNLDPNTSPSRVELRMQEVRDLENRIRRFQATVQQDLEREQVRLLQPIMQKVEEIITEIASEGNYDYILDTSYGTVLHARKGDDLMEEALNKLIVAME